MQRALTKLVTKALQDTIDNINSGNCELTEEEASEILSVLSHKVLSKEQACEYVGLRRSQFDNLVAIGKLPNGRKRRGFKELVWYQDELDDAITNNGKYKNR